MKTTPQRKTSPERRQEIAHAVLELIGKRGASSLTAATIAESVGLTSGALFRHFDSTEAMLEAAVDLAIERARECFPAEDLPALERLQGLLLARITTIRKYPGLAWLLLSEQASLTIPPRAVARLATLVQDSRRFLKAALDEAIEEGELRDDIPVPIMLTLLTGVVHSLSSVTGVHAGRKRTGPNPAAVFHTLLEMLGAENITS